MIRAFVFDLDGTLVETEELKALSYARAAVELRPDLSEGEVVAAFGDLVGLSRREVAVGLMRRFGLEDAASARMAPLGVDAPWQAYVEVRLGIYEVMLDDPKLIEDHRYPHTISLLRNARREGYPTPWPPSPTASRPSAFWTSWGLGRSSTWSSPATTSSAANLTPRCPSLQRASLG